MNNQSTKTNTAARTDLLDVEASQDDPNAEYARLDRHPAYLRLQQMQRLAKRSNLSDPYFDEHEGPSTDIIVSGDRSLVNFAGYNYLGLSGRSEVSGAAKSAIDSYGTSVSASRLVSGEIPLHRELEGAIADFLGVDDALACVSGYGTNTTTIGHLFSRRDLIVHDELAHNSIVMGCQLSGARRLTFRHNDLDQLDRILHKHRGSAQRVCIIVEGLYSMHGDVPDIEALVAIKRKHHALLMIDEAHSIGVLGRGGRGLTELAGVDVHDIDIIMGTLSKAFASCGGFIAGSQPLVDNLRYFAPGFMYSVGMSPANAAAALCSINILEREPHLVTTLRERACYFRELAFEAGLTEELGTATPIVPILTRDAVSCVALYESLKRDGLLCQPIIDPAVKANTSRVRFFLTVLNTEEQIRFAIETLTKYHKV